MTAASDDTPAAAGDAIITADTTGHITSWNPAAERLLGHRGADAIGPILALIVPEQYRGRHAAAFHAALETRKPAHDGAPAHVGATTATGATVPLIMTLGLLTSGVVAILRPADAVPVPFAGQEPLCTLCKSPTSASATFASTTSRTRCPALAKYSSKPRRPPSTTPISAW